MIVLGFDPGLASLGVAVLEVTDELAVCRGLYVFRTVKADRKRSVRAVDDNADRLDLQVGRILSVVDLDTVQRPAVVAMEMMSFPRSSSAAAKLGMANAAVLTLAHIWGAAVVGSTPQELKSGTVGRKDASKTDVEAWGRAQYDCPEPVDHTGRAVARSYQEHAWDALGAAHCALSSPAVMVARRL